MNLVVEPVMVASLVCLFDEVFEVEVVVGVGRLRNDSDISLSGRRRRNS